MISGKLPTIGHPGGLGAQRRPFLGFLELDLRYKAMQSTIKQMKTVKGDIEVSMNELRELERGIVSARSSLAVRVAHFVEWAMGTSTCTCYIRSSCRMPEISKAGIGTSW